jgi:hypothetical protein
MSRKRKIFYSRLAEASAAAIALGITTAVEYQAKRNLDPKLPSCPQRVYKTEWQCWPSFLGKEVKQLYPSIAEASKAAVRLGCKTVTEYEVKRYLDPRLPSNPELMYKEEWQSWPSFFSKEPKQFYSTLAEFFAAVIELGVSTSKEYQKKRYLDPQLPSRPQDVYKTEWQGWSSLWGKDVKRPYSKLSGASAAAMRLGIATSTEYRVKRNLDPRLPESPRKLYKGEWKNWPSFLGEESKQFYSALAEASAVVIRLGITTAGEYQEKRHVDPRLPASPKQVYKAEWQGWPSFLGKEVKQYYLTLAEASAAAIRLEITSPSEYRDRRHLDSQLPSAPDQRYQDEWKNWPSFFCRVVMELYPTLAEASAAIIALEITGILEYQRKRHLDPRLPGSPWTVYKTEWQGWSSFFGKNPKRLYPSLSEASAAAIALEITSYGEYQVKRYLDPSLPSKPSDVYKAEWQSWPSFLGKEPKQLYPTLEEASIAAKGLEITTSIEYQERRHLDPRLPSSPDRVYKAEWQSWPSFVGKGPKQFYPTLAEASAGTIALGITTSGEYKLQRHLDPRLPSTPSDTYKAEWKGWSSFFGKVVKDIYPTLMEATTAAKLLDIKTLREYRQKRYLDPRLPASPSIVYKAEWKSWPSFLGKKIKKFYSTLAEAAAAVMALGITTSTEYREKRHLDLQLPFNPSSTYKTEWQSWSSFFGKCFKRPYSTMQEASVAAMALDIATYSEYQVKRYLNPRLPSNPSNTYKAEWQDWVPFLLPKICKTLRDVKFSVKVLGVMNSHDYREKRKSYPVLPAKPERKFESEWVDWHDTCDIPKPYSYDESVSLIAQERLTSKREYIDYIIKSGDPRLPRTPDQVYKEQWINWYAYLGTREPYRVKNIRSPYTQWAECIQEFLRGARGGNTKESHLCRFVRYYIQNHEMGESPQKFLTLEKKDIRPFKEWLAVNESKGLAHKTLTSVNEFLDFVVHEYMTDEDEETGELVLLANTHNPFSSLSVENPLYSNSKSGESVKHALAYQYVGSAKQWIIPQGAKNFSDLRHLQCFTADWFDIDPERIDRTDPNCVFREHDGKCQIWFPVYWLHTYALMSVPARGRQIAYCDSGEADSLIPIITGSGSIDWDDNKSVLAGLTNNQGFIKHYENGELGMHFTSNKTSSNSNGYSVAWIPEDLAYWMVVLRNWQTKYNPISRPMPWLECLKTSLNEKQRMAKGANCFLFRDFGAEESGHFSGRLASRLSAALYHSQPNDLELASLSGLDKTVLSRYSSRYTPHSMRVSLITAYLDEFGLPLTVIMKVAGHSSIVMTIYYCKLGSEGLRRRFSEGEKRAMQNESYAAQRMIEQGRIDEIKNKLIATSSDALNLISNETPVGTYLFRDYGICPYGGDRCSDGGDIIQSSQIRAATPLGYLGVQNCIACRHFITGPAFLGGLLSLSNEISLASHLQSEQYHQLEQELQEFNKQLNECDDAAYDAEVRGESVNLGARNNLELQKRKTLSEIEAAAKKLDSLLCDMNKSSKLIKQCQALVNQEVEDSGDEAKSPTKLIVQKDHELHVNYEEVSRFKQFSEVCENADIYQSASSEMALAPRSQLIDKMALRNKVPVHMFMLDKKQQLVVGNQITRLMLDRLKSWNRVDALMDGRICLDDLDPNERITKQEFLQLATPGSGFDRVESVSGELL